MYTHVTEITHFYISLNTTVTVFYFNVHTSRLQSPHVFIARAEIPNFFDFSWFVFIPFMECTTRNTRQMLVFDSLTRGRLCDPDRTYNRFWPHVCTQTSLWNFQCCCTRHLPLLSELFGLKKNSKNQLYRKEYHKLIT